MTEPYLSGTQQDQPAEARELPHKHVLMFLAEGFEDVEAASVLDICGWTRYRPAFATVDVTICALHPQVNGAFGLQFAADVVFDQVNSSDTRKDLYPDLCSRLCSDYDALVIPGGFHNLGFDEAYDERLRQLARAMHEAGKPLATMCVGILPVAEAGLLAGGTATTYALSSRHDNLGRLRELGCQVVEDPVVEWNGIISCSGPAYSDQVVYTLLRTLIGAEAAAEVERYRNGRRCGC